MNLLLVKNVSELFELSKSKQPSQGLQGVAISCIDLTRCEGEKMVVKMLEQLPASAILHLERNSSCLMPQDVKHNS